MEKDSVKKNFIFQLLYQFIILVVPLIVAPYLTRTLGDTQIGIYTYSYTIAYYFVVAAMLGINKYGQRIISSSKDEIELRKNFWSLFIFHIIISSFCLLLYFLVIFFYDVNNRSIYYIQGIFVLSAIFDITWLFYGLENFRKIVIRNAFLKILECIFIFLLIKKPDDIYIYTTIKVLSTLIGQIMMLPIAFKNIKFTKFNFSDMVKHLKPLLTFGVFVLASLLYTVLDKTLIGIICTNEDVAYYEYSNKILEIPKTFSFILVNILFPKACFFSKNNDFNKLDKYVKLCFIFVFYICFGSIFGLLFLSNDFSLIYYGESFAECGNIIKYLSPIILLISICNILESLFIIPRHKEKILMISILIGAISNVIFSLIFINLFGVYGAVFGTILAELIKLIIQTIYCKKYFNFFKIVRLSFVFILSGIIMATIIYLCKSFMVVSILNLVLEAIIGLLIYSLLIALYLFFIDDDKFLYRLTIAKLFYTNK